MTNPADLIFMRRALQLAENGRGAVSPNPLVGCVIVCDNKIIGEGWHRQYGQAHAEVNAVAAVITPELLPQSTVYVNLEPCSHFGKTPPCADMLIAQRVRSVVIANEDPNPLVNKRGIEKLRQAGIEVTTDVLVDEGAWLNRRFFTSMIRIKVDKQCIRTPAGPSVAHAGRCRAGGQQHGDV